MTTMTRLLCGDCLEVMRGMDTNSVDAICCDPPYGLNFMSSSWDHGVPGVPFWEAALRVAKPGAHLLAFGGSRTHHRLMCAIEDAGWEIRDCLMWLYGSGFPKSASVSKLIDKAAGAEREVIGIKNSNRPNVIGQRPGGSMGGGSYTERLDTAPATDAARQWDGWGTALKPSWEPIIMARKPLTGTVADNVLAWGTGALAIDKCRIGNEPRTQLEAGFIRRGRTDEEVFSTGYGRPKEQFDTTQGRWPANLIIGDDETAALLDEQSGERKSGGHKQGSRQGRGVNGIYGDYDGFAGQGYEANTGGASRFFYCSKASKRDRDEGLEGMPERVIRITDGHGRGAINTSKGDGTGLRENKPRHNVHPTVKPTSLMRWLVRLITPPGGTVLDCFMGSGSTGKAAVLEGFSFIGIDKEAEYLTIAAARIEHASSQVEAQMQMPLLELELT